MTYTNGMRPLSADEISFVAGGWGTTNTVTVTQSNTGTATAISSKGGDDAIAKNNQVNFNVVGVQAYVKVEKFHIL